MTPAISTLTVVGFGGFADLLDVSPFVHKLEAHLRLADVPYDKRIGDVRKAPRQKLPFIELAGERVPDSQAALEHLAARGIADLDDWLDADQRADAHALRSMLELDLYFVVSYCRWVRDEGWASYRGAIGAAVAALGVPRFLIPIALRVARRGTLAQLDHQGVARRDAAEVEARGRAIVDTLERFAARSDGPWWFGARPSSLDAVVHAFVRGMTCPEIESPLRDALDRAPTLAARLDHASAAIMTIMARGS